MAGGPECQFDAFISYRRSDGKTAARWLRRELERFLAPKPLRDRFGRKLRLYLDTAYERGTIDFYEQSIKPALLASRYLLVVATPDAMRRPGVADDWIEREIRDFAAGPNGQNIIAVRGAGEFDGPLPGDLKTRFPNIEIVDLRGAGRLSFLNPVRAARLASEKLKIVAPLLAIPHDEMPRLRQEEEKHQQTRLGSLFGTTAGVVVAVTALSIFALTSRNAAIRALEDSMFAAGSMALEASRLGTRDAAMQRTRKLIVNRGCDLVDKFRLGAGSEPQIAEVVMCRLERALERERLREHDLARGQFADAIRLAETRHEKSGRIDAALGILQAREALAGYVLRRKDAAGAESEYATLAADSRRLASVHEGRPEFARSEAEALGQRGDLRVAREEHALAAQDYEDAAAALARSMAIREASGVGGRADDVDTLEWLARLHRIAGVQRLAQNAYGKAAEQFEQAIAGLPSAEKEERPSLLELESALAHAFLFEAEKKRGNGAAASTARANALLSVERLTVAADASSEQKERAAKIKEWLASRAEN